MSIVIKYAFLVGFLVIIMISLINIYLTNTIKNVKKELSDATDDRMKITKEVFNNIRFIKMSAWE